MVMNVLIADSVKSDGSLLLDWSGRENQAPVVLRDGGNIGGSEWEGQSGGGME